MLQVIPDSQRYTALAQIKNSLESLHLNETFTTPYIIKGLENTIADGMDIRAVLPKLRLYKVHVTSKNGQYPSNEDVYVAAPTEALAIQHGIKRCAILLKVREDGLQFESLQAIGEPDDKFVVALPPEGNWNG